MRLRLSLGTQACIFAVVLGVALLLAKYTPRKTAMVEETKHNMPFTATTAGQDKLGLWQMLEDFANERWIPDYLDDEQRVA